MKEDFPTPPPPRITILRSKIISLSQKNNYARVPALGELGPQLFMQNPGTQSHDST